MRRREQAPAVVAAQAAVLLPQVVAAVDVAVEVEAVVEAQEQPPERPRPERKRKQRRRLKEPKSKTSSAPRLLPGAAAVAAEEVVAVDASAVGAVDPWWIPASIKSLLR